MKFLAIERLVFHSRFFLGVLVRSFEVKFTTFSSRRNAELGCDLLFCGWRSSTLKQLWVVCVCVFLPVGWLYQRSQRRMHFDVFFRDEFHRKFSWSEDSSHRTYRFGAEGFRPRHLVGRWRKETCFFKSIFSACFGGQYSWKPEIKPKCGRIQVSNDLSSNCAQLNSTNPKALLLRPVREVAEVHEFSCHWEKLGGGFKFLLSPLPGEMIQFDEHIFRMGWNHQLDKRDAHFSGLLCFHNWNSDFTHAGMINGEEMKFLLLVDALGVQKIETTHSWITTKYRFVLSFWVISYNTGWIECFRRSAAQHPFLPSNYRAYGGSYAHVMYALELPLTQDASCKYRFAVIPCQKCHVIPVVTATVTRFLATFDHTFDHLQHGNTM